MQKYLLMNDGREFAGVAVNLQRPLHRFGGIERHAFLTDYRIEKFNEAVDINLSFVI